MELYEVLAHPDAAQKEKDLSADKTEVQSEALKVLGGLSGLLAGAFAGASLKQGARQQMLKALQKHAKDNSTPQRLTTMAPRTPTPAPDNTAAMKAPATPILSPLPEHTTTESESAGVTAVPGPYVPSPSATTRPSPLLTKESGEAQVYLRLAANAIDTGPQKASAHTVGWNPACSEAGETQAAQCGHPGDPRRQRGRSCWRPGDPPGEHPGGGVVRHNGQWGAHVTVVMGEYGALPAPLDMESSSEAFRPASFEDIDRDLLMSDASGSFYKRGLFRHVPPQYFCRPVDSFMPPQGAQEVEPPGHTILSAEAPQDDEAAAAGPYDLLWALLRAATSSLTAKQCWREGLESTARAWIRTWELVQLSAMTLMIVLPFKRRGRRGAAAKQRAIWLQCALAYAVLGTVEAGPTELSARMPHYVRPPQPTDLEIWAAGQLTLREQLALAGARETWNRPLSHSVGEAPTANYAATPGEAVAPEPLPAEQQRAVHISAWIAAPYYQGETVDIGIAFPLQRQRLCRALLDSLNELPDHFDRVVPTYPQLHDCYASCVATYMWAETQGRKTIMIDCRSVGGSVFAAYQEGNTTRRAVLQQLVDVDESEVEIFAYGSTVPLAATDSVQTLQGGLVKILYRGAECIWVDGLDNRLTEPQRWIPHVMPPSPMGGQHVVYQSRDDQVVYEIDPGDGRAQNDIAKEVLDIDDEQVWVHTPSVPAPRLAHAGRSITTQAAVLYENLSPQIGATVLYLDLRGLTFFPQWLVLPDPIFDPLAYLDGLQVTPAQGYTIVVSGGEQLPEERRIRIRSGDTISFHREPVNVSSSVSETDSSGNDSDGEDADSGAGHDNLPDSSDFSGSPPPDDGRRRGPPPPPPQPVNLPEDRSRSPRRNEVQVDNPSALEVRLADHLPPPCFDLNKEKVGLPASWANLSSLLKPWPPSWLKRNFGHVSLPGHVQRAVDEARVD